VLGIIAAGIIKLGRAAIKSTRLAAILVAASLAMGFFRVDFLIVLLIAGLVNLLLAEGLPRMHPPGMLPILAGSLTGALVSLNGKWLQIAWLFLKTGLFSFGGAYASLVFVQRGAVDQFHWLTVRQLLDGVALSVATPGPFMLFTTFAGYLAGGVTGAVLATFFVFLPSFFFVILGAKYIEQVRDNRFVQAYLAGVSAAVVGVILVISLELIPGAFIGPLSAVLVALAFAAITILRVDVAQVAIGAIALGIGYAIWHGIQ
jgi:chromate transporter